MYPGILHMGNMFIGSALNAVLQFFQVLVQQNVSGGVTFNELFKVS